MLVYLKPHSDKLRRIVNMIYVINRLVKRVFRLEGILDIADMPPPCEEGKEPGTHSTAFPRTPTATTAQRHPLYCHCGGGPGQGFSPETQTLHLIGTTYFSIEHAWQMHDWGSHSDWGGHIPHAPFSTEIQLVTRDALATLQPHGLHQGSYGAHVPLPFESKNPQPAGPVTPIGQP